MLQEKVADEAFLVFGAGLADKGCWLNKGLRIKDQGSLPGSPGPENGYVIVV